NGAWSFWGEVVEVVESVGNVEEWQESGEKWGCGELAEKMPAKEKSTKTTLPQPTEKGKVVKVRKVKSPFQLVDEPDEEPAHSEPKPELEHKGEEATRPLLVVEGKCKAIATEEQAGHSLLELHTPKRRSTTYQFVLQRQTPVTEEATTGPSAQAQDDTSVNIIRNSPSPADAETETSAASEKTNIGGDTEILQFNEEQGKDVDDLVNLEEKTDELDQGQAGSDPGRTPESRPPPEQVVMDEDQAGPDPGKIRGALAGPDPEPTHDEFITDLYPKVQENLKFPANEHVILEEPLSSSGTLSSLKNLDDAYTIGDQLINDKSTEDEPGLGVVVCAGGSGGGHGYQTASSPVAPLQISTPIMTPSTIATITTISHAPIPPTTIPSEVLQNLPTFDSVFRFEDRLKSLEANFSEYIQTNPFAKAVSNIPVAADLSEMELKKILIEKMEGDKSVQRSDEQRNLYKALVDAYKADKIILDSYGETVILKRRRDDDDDQDEGPSAGSDRGSKRQREGKEPESASAPLETATRSAGRSTTGSKSRQVSAKESAFTEEPVQTISQVDEPSYSVFEIGADDQTIVQSSQHPEWFSQPKKHPTPDRDWNKTLPTVQGSIQTWISKLAKQANSRSSFNELLDTPLDFSNFIMNRLRVDTLTPELLAGPTFELMKGSCISLIELEYHLEEVYKATKNQLDWVNPEGASSRKYTTSVTKTKAADYRNIKWIEDLFYEFAVNRESALDVYSKKRIIAVTDLKIVDWHSYKHLDWITRRVEDLQLGVESYQKRLNLTKPDTYRSDLKRREAYTSYSNPRGFIYQNKDKKNRLMRIDELHKFSNGTLNDASNESKSSCDGCWVAKSRITHVNANENTTLSEAHGLSLRITSGVKVSVKIRWTRPSTKTDERGGVPRFKGRLQELRTMISTLAGKPWQRGRMPLKKLCPPEAKNKAKKAFAIGVAIYKNPIRTLGDHSKPSHESYKNTIELPVGNNVVPLRSNTIQLVQNGCSFHGLRSEDPNQHHKDFLKLVDSLDLDGSITTREDLTTRFLAQFFPPGRTEKLRNDILMFQQHHGESLSEAWTRQDTRLSKFEANFKQQQSEMTNKIDTVLKAINDRITEALPSDTAKNPKLNVNSTSLVLSAHPKSTVRSMLS
nr:zinc finger, CCHC-type [Tanacetum cinerariifolium]